MYIYVYYDAHLVVTTPCDGRFLGERGKVFNDFFQISSKTASRFWRGQPGLPLASKFENNRWKPSLAHPKIVRRHDKNKIDHH